MEQTLPKNGDGNRLEMSQLEISQLPPFMKKDRGYVVPQIAYYLERIIQVRTGDRKKSLRLPSLRELSGFFVCTGLQMLDVLIILRSRGIHSSFDSQDSSVTVWWTDKKPSIFS